MKKIIFLTCALIIMFCPFCFADQVTLTTYYPAPFGMYQEMRVMGKLGVGTANPTHCLELRAEDAGRSAVRISHANAAGWAGLDFYDQQNTFHVGAVGYANTGTLNPNRFYFGTVDDTGTGNVVPVTFMTQGLERMRITSTGLIGIGTTDPQSELEVVHDFAGASEAANRGITSTGYGDVETAPLISVKKARGTSASPAALQIGDRMLFRPIPYNGSQFVKPAYAGFIVDDAVGGGLVPTAFIVGTGTGVAPNIYGTERMRVSSAGNVGIATTAPAYPLQVGVPTGPAPASANGIEVAIQNDLWVDGNIYADSIGGWTRNNTDGFLYPTTITDSVGIGTSDPRATLDINPNLGGSGDDVLKKTSLLSVGDYGYGSVEGTATAQIYGTMLVSDVAAFGGRVGFFDDIQLQAKLSANGCAADKDIGRMQLVIDVPNKKGYLNICDYDSGTLTWINIKNWDRDVASPPPSGEPQIFLE